MIRTSSIDCSSLAERMMLVTAHSIVCSSCSALKLTFYMAFLKIPFLDRYCSHRTQLVCMLTPKLKEFLMHFKCYLAINSLTYLLNATEPIVIISHQLVNHRYPCVRIKEICSDTRNLASMRSKVQRYN